MACAFSKDADQPGHPPSPIRVFAVCMKKGWVLGYPLSAQRRLISLGRSPGWPKSLLGTHATLLVLSWGGLFLLKKYWNKGTFFIQFWFRVIKIWHMRNNHPALYVRHSPTTCSIQFDHDHLEYFNSRKIHDACYQFFNLTKDKTIHM